MLVKVSCSVVVVVRVSEKRVCDPLFETSTTKSKSRLLSTLTKTESNEEHLHTQVPGIDNVRPTQQIQTHSGGCSVKLAVAFTCATPSCDKLAVCLEHLNAADGVRDQDHSQSTDSHSNWPNELARTRTLAAPFAKEMSVRIEDLNSVISVIHNEHLVGGG